MRARLTLSLVLAAATVFPLGAQTVIRYTDFSSQSGLTLNDAVASGGTIMLASSQRDRRGSFFTSAQYDVSNFSAVFQFRISSPGGISDGIAAGADGLAFVIQRTGATALGSFGSGIGYEGIANSAIVEFDKPSDSELELLINNKCIGLGQAVKVGENFGLRITRIGSLHDRITALGKK